MKFRKGGVKDFQQEIIADTAIITMVDLSKKQLPKILEKEIAIKKKNRLNTITLSMLEEQ